MIPLSSVSLMILLTQCNHVTTFPLRVLDFHLLWHHLTRAISLYVPLHSLTIPSALFGHLMYVYRGRTLSSRMNQSKILTQSAQIHEEPEWAKDSTEEKRTWIECLLLEPEDWVGIHRIYTSQQVMSQKYLNQQPRNSQRQKKILLNHVYTTP